MVVSTSNLVEIITVWVKHMMSHFVGQ